MGSLTQLPQVVPPKKAANNLHVSMMWAILVFSIFLSSPCLSKPVNSDDYIDEVYYVDEWVEVEEETNENDETNETNGCGGFLCAPGPSLAHIQNRTSSVAGSGTKKKLKKVRKTRKCKTVYLSGNCWKKCKRSKWARC